MRSLELQRLDNAIDLAVRELHELNEARSAVSMRPLLERVLDARSHNFVKRLSKRLQIFARRPLMDAKDFAERHPDRPVLFTDWDQASVREIEEALWYLLREPLSSRFLEALRAADEYREEQKQDITARISKLNSERERLERGELRKEA